MFQYTYASVFFFAIDYDLAYQQTFQNVVHVKSNSRATFNILYEEVPTGIDLNREKFLHQATLSLDLEGFFIRDLSAEIMSPNYPDFYPNSADILWFVRVPVDYRVSVTISDLAIEQCCDRLTIYDGSSNQDPVLGGFTGRNVPNAPIVSASNTLHLRFSSDCSLSERGFRALIKPVSDTNITNRETTTPYNRITSPSLNNATCNGVEYLYINPSYTYVYSPGYPYSYANNLNCHWRFYSSYSYYVIQLNVLEIDLEWCCDHVDVYDGSSSSYPKLARLSQNSSRLHSTGRYMYLTFTTDHSVTDRGFRFSVRATTPPTGESTTRSTARTEETSNSGNTCSGIEQLYIYTSGTYIYSPGYPYSYSNNLYCQWRLYSPYYQYVVRLYVDELKLGSSADYVDVYDGYSSSYAKLARLSESDQSGSDIMSTGQYMYLIFRTDSYGTDNGFRFRINAVTPSLTTSRPDDNTTSQASCNETEFVSIFPDSSRYIASPGYPYYPYPNNYHCSWRIYSRAGYDLKLEVLHLELEQDYDYVDIYDGPSSSHPKLARLSGTNRPDDIVSSWLYLYLIFSTDSSISDKGFQFRISVFIPSTTSLPDTLPTSPTSCSGTDDLYASSTAQYILSPNYPNSYIDNLKCKWRISASYSGYVVQLFVLDLHLQNCCDYVDIYDGSSTSNSKITRLTSKVENAVFHSTQRYMFIRFKTDDSGTRKGFRFIYTSTYPPSDVPEITTKAATIQEHTTNELDEQTPTAPAWSYSYLHPSFAHLNLLSTTGYPNNHPAGLNHFWVITASTPYYLIQLTIIDIDIENGANSNHGLIQIYDGQNSHATLLRSINTNLNVIVYSNGYSMYVTYQSDWNRSFKGFQAAIAPIYLQNCLKVDVPQNVTANPSNETDLLN